MPNPVEDMVRVLDPTVPLPRRDPRRNPNDIVGDAFRAIPQLPMLPSPEEMLPRSVPTTPMPSPPRSDWAENLPRIKNDSVPGPNNMREVLPPELFYHYQGINPMMQQGDPNAQTPDAMMRALMAKKFTQGI